MSPQLAATVRHANYLLNTRKVNDKQADRRAQRRSTRGIVVREGGQGADVGQATLDGSSLFWLSKLIYG